MNAVKISSHYQAMFLKDYHFCQSSLFGSFEGIFISNIEISGIILIYNVFYNRTLQKQWHRPRRQIAEGAAVWLLILNINQINTRPNFLDMTFLLLSIN